MPLSAQRRNRTAVGIATLVMLVLLLWALRHVQQVLGTSDAPSGPFGLIFALAFVLLLWQALLYSLDKPFTVTDEQQAELDKLGVAVAVPVYEEDPGYLKLGLQSLKDQERPLQQVVVVDDGSTVDYSETQAWFREVFGDAGVWLRTANAGKRHAQGTAVQHMDDSIDAVVTVDSDGILDRLAVGELLKPFVRPRVQSVAGVVLAENNRTNLLTRLTDLWFVTGQLVDRSAASVMGSVLVNSGVLAVYRKQLIVDNMDAYLNETFCGRRVEFSDDSKLTMFALTAKVRDWVRGKWRIVNGSAVQQSSAFAFTAMPENLSHHLRQYTRWMRGATIRTFDRFGDLPLDGYAYWAHLISWVQMTLSSIVFVTLFVYGPVVQAVWTPTLLLIPALISYGMALRYLTVKRSDEGLGSQLLTVLLAPLAMLWAFFVLRGVRWYAMATCTRTGWGTRQAGVEVVAK